MTVLYGQVITERKKCTLNCVDPFIAIPTSSRHRRVWKLDVQYFCHPSPCNVRLCQLPTTVVSANAMQTSVAGQLLKQTTVHCLVGGKLCTPNSAAFCCTCQFHRRQKTFSPRTALTWAVSRFKANGANCVVTCALSNCRNKALTNGKLACCMKTEIPEGSLWTATLNLCLD